MKKTTDVQSIMDFIETIAKLRDPTDGCPWDLEQTHQSLTKYLIEECYEYLDAVERNDVNGMREELGDILLQVVLNAQLAKDNGDFDIIEVTQQINEKMIYRHPHVFKKRKNLTTEQISEQWQSLKDYKSSSTFSERDLMNSPLIAASRIGEKSKSVNFDWENKEQVWEKVEEELQEVKEAKTQAELQDEIGDLLFSVAQYARWNNIDPEQALKDANKKFVNRFCKVESVVHKSGKTLGKLTTMQLDKIWQQIKKD